MVQNAVGRVLLCRRGWKVFPAEPRTNLAPRSPVSGTLMPNFGFTGSHPPNYEGTDDGESPSLILGCF
jgi:hypothetical protein